MGYENLEELIEVIRRLRAPDGCKWDREQTHYSLRPNMLEEAYEAVDAIDDNDMVHLKEELGDVLLQVVLHAQIASEENEFNIDDVAKGIKDKLIHRHPHVFGTTKVSSTAEILDNWDKLKAEEKPHRKSAMDGISKSAKERSKPVLNGRMKNLCMNASFPNLTSLNKHALNMINYIWKKNSATYSLPS